jgi:hypothetical protein
MLELLTSEPFMQKCLQLIGNMYMCHWHQLTTSDKSPEVLFWGLDRFTWTVQQDSKGKNSSETL